MRLLLDSHALLWFCEGNLALSGPARAAIEDLSNEKLEVDPGRSIRCIRSR